MVVSWCYRDLDTITSELCKKDLQTLEIAINAEKYGTQICVHI
jgi:hypothetical protein